jgi:hypothetical protein
MGLEEKYELNPEELKNFFSCRWNKNIDVWNEKKSFFDKCHARLSHYPIAKNLRFVASDFVEGLDKGKHSLAVSPFPRKGEFMFVKKSLNWKSWYPWIWSPENSWNSSGWNKFFELPEYNSLEKLRLNSNEKVVESNLGYFDGVVDKLIKHIICLGLVFRLKKDLEENAKRILPPEKILKECIGVHIRRGETVAANISQQRIERPDVYPTKVYARKISLSLDKNGSDSIFVATDSEEVIEELSKLLPGIKIYNQDFSRSLFYRYDPATNYTVEDYVKRNPSLSNYYATSAIFDLLGISLCKAFVGPLDTSEFSKAAYYLQCFNKRTFTDYISVGSKLSILDKSLTVLI